MYAHFGCQICMSILLVPTYCRSAEKLSMNFEWPTFHSTSYKKLSFPNLHIFQIPVKSIQFQEPTLSGLVFLRSLHGQHSDVANGRKLLSRN
jgi:hypothetical protein